MTQPLDLALGYYQTDEDDMLVGGSGNQATQLEYILMLDQLESFQEWSGVKVYMQFLD